MSVCLVMESDCSVVVLQTNCSRVGGTCGSLTDRYAKKLGWDHHLPDAAHF